MHLPSGILIVNNDEIESKIIEESLRQTGVQERIGRCSGSGEALKFLDSHRHDLPKLIIVDMNMPHMDGMISVRQIVATHHVRVLAYAASCPDELVHDVKTSGAVDCVKKGTSFADNSRFARRVVEAMKEIAPGDRKTGLITCL